MSSLAERLKARANDFPPGSGARFTIEEAAAYVDSDKAHWRAIADSDEDEFPADIYANVIWQYADKTMTICNSIHIAGKGAVAWRPLPTPFTAGVVK